MTSRRARPWLACLVLVGLLTACSGGDDDSDGSGPTDADGVATIHLGLPGPLAVDPARASLASPSDMMVLDLLHDGLTRVRGGQVVAALARDWVADPTMTTWRFTLDPSATFTSGRPVTAADVVASLQHVASGGDASLAALRLELVNGFRAFLDGTAGGIAGLRAPDPATVEIVLDTPLSILPSLLASPAYGVIDLPSVEAAAGDDDGARNLDLSGDWEVTEADEDHLLVARRDGAEGGLEAVELRPYSDSADAYDAFRDDEVDWAPVPSEEYGDAVDEYGDDHFAPFQAELYFGLNLASPTLANTELRRAIAAAVDRDAIVRAVYPDLADPLPGLVPAGVPGHEPRPCPVCEHDPARARQLLAAAFPDGVIPTVNIDFDESPAQEAMAAIVAGSLEEVGIPVVQRPLPLEDYERFVVSGGQELFSFGWIGGYPSPDAYLAPLFGSQSNDNLTGLRSPDIDALLNQARAEPFGASTMEHWAIAEAGILDAAVVIPIAQFRTQVVVSDRVQGLEHAVDGTVDWASVTLEPG